MYQRHETGKIGENIAAKYLQENGYHIIQRNFQCNQGEIDIIAKENEEYVFIEVKTRTNIKYGKPKEAVNTAKKKHIYQSVEYYTYSKHIENQPIRIDVIEIYQKKDQYHIHHIKQAITEPPKFLTKLYRK